MKDTFKKFGKDAISNVKSEGGKIGKDAITVAKAETESIISNQKSEIQAEQHSISEKFIKKATGSSDLLEIGDIDTTNSMLKYFMLKNEVGYHYLVSVDQEIIITNFGILYSIKESITSSKNTLSRIDFKDNQITELRVETAGKLDRDAELKFKLGETDISWDIRKEQLVGIFEINRDLSDVALTQSIYLNQIDNLKQSLGYAQTSLSKSTSSTSSDEFKNIVEYSEKRLNDKLVLDFSESFKRN